MGVAAGSETEEPEWRREVSRRLEEYRARRRRLHPDDSQSGLPFMEESDPDEDFRERPRQRLVRAAAIWSESKSAFNRSLIFRALLTIARTPKRRLSPSRI